VVLEALRIPHGLGRRFLKYDARLIQFADPERRRALGQKRGESVGALGGERPELLLQGRRLDECDVGARVQVVGYPRLRGFEAHARRGADRDPLDPRPRALRHRVKRADVLDLVAEEVEPVGLRRRDRVDVDDPAAHRVVARRLADGLAVIVECPQAFEQALERLLARAHEDDLAGGVLLDRRDLLQERRGRCEHRERGPLARVARARLAQPREDGQAVPRRGERLAHVAAVGNRFRKHERLDRRGAAGGTREEGRVLGQLLRGLQVWSHDEPHAGRVGAHRLGEDGSTSRRAYADDPVPGRPGHPLGAVGSRATSAALAASSSAAFFEGPRPEPSLRSRR